MQEYQGNTVEYWKQNAEEDYIKTPISVLKYIAILEEQAEGLHKHQQHHHHAIISNCGSLNHFDDIANLGRCDECLQTKRP